MGDRGEKYLEMLPQSVSKHGLVGVLQRQTYRMELDSCLTL